MATAKRERERERERGEGRRSEGEAKEGGEVREGKKGGRGGNAAEASVHTREAISVRASRTGNIPSARLFAILSRCAPPGRAPLYSSVINYISNIND